MGPFDVLTILLTLSGIFSYLNHRYIKLPLSIGVMAIGLFMSITLILLQKLTSLHLDPAFNLLTQIDFERTFFYELLGLLIFAGALNIRPRTLAEEKWGILVLSTISISISTFVVGTLLWGLMHVMKLHISIYYALAFGALISPTDPVVILGLLKKNQSKLPKKFYGLLVGESLFNDALSLVLFGLFLQLAEYENRVPLSHALELATGMLLYHTLGGILVGGLMAFLGNHFLSKVDHPHVQILMTLGLVTSGYDLCQIIDVSAPIAVVLMGLIIGHSFRKRHHHEDGEEHLLFSFWEIIDEFLNSFLFIMVGIEILSLHLTDWWKMSIIAPLSILLVIIARWISLRAVVRLFPRFFRGMDNRSVRIMTWVGMRGGISLALALILPEAHSQHIIFITYVVVVFSILIQGLSTPRVLSKMEINPS